MPPTDPLFDPPLPGSPAYSAIAAHAAEQAALAARWESLAAAEHDMKRDDPESYWRQYHDLQRDALEFRAHWAAVNGAALGMGCAVAAYAAVNSPDATERAEAARALQIIDAARTGEPVEEPS